MRRWAAAAFGLLVLCWAGAAGALPIAGPTPDGTGKYGYCEGAYQTVASTEKRYYLTCTYGIPATGVTVTGLQLHWEFNGWFAFAGGAGPTAVGCSLSGFLNAGSTTAGVYRGGQCMPYIGIPDQVRFAYSDGSTHPASLPDWVAGGAYQPTPGWGFRSGMTGINERVYVAPVDHVPDLLDEGRATLITWAERAVRMVGAVGMLGLGAHMIVHWLRRGAVAAGVAENDGSDTYGEVVDTWSSPPDDGEDDQSDDGDDEESVTNIADDLSDDEGEEMDDGSEGGVGLGDVEFCVSCGDELEFGWDFDECPTCGGV